MIKKMKGLTLVELVVTLAIAAIVSLIAVPHMKKFMAKQRLSADLLKIKSTIETARNQAISNKQTIRICGALPDLKSTHEATLDCKSDWTQLTVIKTKGLTQSKVLHQQTLAEHYRTVQWSAFQRKPYLELTPYGFTNHQNGTLYLCHKKYSSLHRAVMVSKTGRVTISKNNPNIKTKCNP